MQVQSCLPTDQGASVGLNHCILNFWVRSPCCSIQSFFGIVLNLYTTINLSIMMTTDNYLKGKFCGPVLNGSPTHCQRHTNPTLYPSTTHPALSRLVSLVTSQLVCLSTVGATTPTFASLFCVTKTQFYLLLYIINTYSIHTS